MTYLFWDMEMYRKDRKKFFSDSKIIAIGFSKVNKNINDYVEKHRDYPRIHIWTEWKMNGEKNLVIRFFDYLERLKNSGVLYLVGYGIMTYDIPFLIQRLHHYGVRTIEELNEFFHDLMCIDLKLIGLLFNRMKFKGSTLSNTVDRIKYRDPILNKPHINESGFEMHELYEKQMHQKIEDHLKNDIKAVIWLFRTMEKQLMPMLKTNLLSHS